MLTGPDYTLIKEKPPTMPPNPTPILDNLRAAMKEPGTFFRVATYTSSASASTVASSYRHKKKKRVPPPGQWEFVNGPTEEGRFGVWACYLGPEDDDDG